MISTHSSSSMSYVVDTDCINFLLSFKPGRKILKCIKMMLPPSILEELNPNERDMLKEYNVEVVDLEQKDRDWAEKMIFKISQDKQQRKWYREGRIKRCRNVGECEGAAVSRKLGIDLVLLDKGARSVIKKAFQFHEVAHLGLPVFGLKILEKYGTKPDIEEFCSELRKRLHLGCPNA